MKVVEAAPLPFKGLNDGAQWIVAFAVHDDAIAFALDANRNLVQQRRIELSFDLKDNACLRLQAEDQLPARVESDDLASIHHRHAVTQTLRLFHEVRRQQDGLALLADASDQIPHRMPGLRV